MKIPWGDKYAKEVQEELDKVLDLMEEEWSFRPDVKLVVEPVIRVRADFDLKGFAHEGRNIYISQHTSKSRRKPRQVVREIASELTTHRNTCKECGEGIPSLYQREFTLAAATGNLRWNSPAVTDRARDSIQQNPNYLLAPDAVERALHPIKSRKILKLQALFRTQLEEEAKLSKSSINV